jgi:hypothetical protein
MKKLAFYFGLGVGFLLGSKAGTGPYQKLEAKVRSIATRPGVHDAVETTKAAAVGHVTGAGKKLSERISGADERAVPSTPSAISA